MTAPSLRAFVFDLDGLILDTESALIDAYAEMHAKYGIPFDRELFHRSVGEADYSFDPWHGFDKRADRAALEVERRDRNRQIDRHLSPLPGVVALLDEARAAGIAVGLASNSRHAHVEGHLGRLGLLDRFAVIACREDVASPKPEPDVYRHAVNQLGARPSEAVAFEDSRTGSLAAKRAGLWVVAVPNASTRHHDFSHVDWRVGALSEVTLAGLRRRFIPGDTAVGGRPAGTAGSAAPSGS